MRKIPQSLRDERRWNLIVDDVYFFWHTHKISFCNIVKNIGAQKSCSFPKLANCLSFFFWKINARFSRTVFFSWRKCEFSQIGTQNSSLGSWAASQNFVQSISSKIGERWRVLYSPRYMRISYWHRAATYLRPWALQDGTYCIVFVPWIATVIGPEHIV